MTLKVVINGTDDITSFVSSVNLSGDTSKFNRQLDVAIHSTSDGRKASVKVTVGDKVTFRYKNDLRFIGIVFKVDLSSDGTLSLTAYDSNVYLAKSNDNRIFLNKKASEIIRILAKDFGIPIGDIADTGFVIPYLKFQNKTLYDMVLTSLTLTRNQTGKRFFIGNSAGKLTLFEGAKVSKRYVFKDRENLISASYSQSIEDTKTQIKVIGGKKGKETTVIVKDDAKRQKYGVLQIVEVLDEKATPSQVKQRAATLLKQKSTVFEQLSVEVLGVPEVDVGTPVYISNQMTNTNGAYFVTMVKHSYTSGLHTMSLELTRTYELPDIEISADTTTKPTQKKTTKKKAKGETKK